MCWKESVWVLVVAILMPVGGVVAETINWTNDDPLNSSWCDSDNWNPKQIPVGGDNVIIGPTSPERGPIIGTEICGDVTVGVIQGPGGGVDKR
ncbi:MAG: hypothetical protein ACYTBJ_22375 [Planctomycetota bacterium]|jgi:hypothetical protein